MNNNFAEEYNTCKALEAKQKEWWGTKTQEEHRANLNLYAHLDSIIAKGMDYYGVYKLYANMRERGNDRLDISENPNDARGTVEAMKKYGFTEFTYSSAWTSSAEGAWEFQQAGCKVQGLVEVTEDSRGWDGGYHLKTHGYLFAIK